MRIKSVILLALCLGLLLVCACADGKPSGDATPTDAQVYIRYYLDGDYYEAEDPAFTMPPDAVPADEYEKVNGTPEPGITPIPVPKQTDSQPGTAATNAPATDNAPADGGHNNPTDAPAVTDEPDDLGGSTFTGDPGEGAVVVDFGDLFGDEP